MPKSAKSGNKEPKSGSSPIPGLESEEPEWVGTNWDARQWEFIQWEATPSYARTPNTVEDLAKKLGVTDRTLRRWRKLEGFYNEVRALVRKYLEQDLSSFYYALAEQAKRGSFVHIKMVLELLGEYTDHHDITSGGRPFPVRTYDYGGAVAGISPHPEVLGNGHLENGKG